jgi:hypothetical protein
VHVSESATKVFADVRTTITPFFTTDPPSLVRTTLAVAVRSSVKSIGLPDPNPALLLLHPTKKGTKNKVAAETPMTEKNSFLFIFSIFYIQQINSF